MALALGWIARQALAEGIPSTSGSTATLYYAGYVEDDTGALSGSTAFELSIWRASSGGGAPLCDTGSVMVDVDDGHFRIPLPYECVETVRANPDLYVQVRVAGDALPRQHLGAVPYAVEAEHAVRATHADSLGAPRRAVRTTGTYTGRVVDGPLVGRDAARSICQREMSSDTAHVCYGSELARLAQETGMAPSAPAARYATEGIISDRSADGFHIYGDCSGFTSDLVECGTSAWCYAVLWNDGPVYCNHPTPIWCCD